MTLEELEKKLQTYLTVLQDDQLAARVHIMKAIAQVHQAMYLNRIAIQLEDHKLDTLWGEDTHIDLCDIKKTLDRLTTAIERLESR